MLAFNQSFDTEPTALSFISSNGHRLPSHRGVTHPDLAATTRCSIGAAAAHKCVATLCPQMRKVRPYHPASTGPQFRHARDRLARGSTCGTDATPASLYLASQPRPVSLVSPVFPFSICAPTTPYIPFYILDSSCNSPFTMGSILLHVSTPSPPTCFTMPYTILLT